MDQNVDQESGDAIFDQDVKLALTLSMLDKYRSNDAHGQIQEEFPHVRDRPKSPRDDLYHKYNSPASVSSDQCLISDDSDHDKMIAEIPRPFIPRIDDVLSATQYYNLPTSPDHPIMISPDRTKPGVGKSLGIKRRFSVESDVVPKKICVREEFYGDVDCYSDSSPTRGTDYNCRRRSCETEDSEDGDRLQSLSASKRICRRSSGGSRTSSTTSQKIQSDSGERHKPSSRSPPRHRKRPSSDSRRSSQDSHSRPHSHKPSAFRRLSNDSKSSETEPKKVDSRRPSSDSQNSSASTSSLSKLLLNRPLLSGLSGSISSVGGVPCLTRRQSRELSRIIHGKDALRDHRRSIHLSLDPSIFDAEISDSGSDDDREELGEELKEELKELLAPCQLDMDTYEESVEDKMTSSDDELPDLDDDDDYDDNNQTQVRTEAEQHRSHNNVTPVFDKLKFKPLVLIEDCMAHLTKVKKRLKLKSSATSSALPESGDDTSQSSFTSKSELIWTPRQTDKLQDICSKVKIKLTKCSSPAIENQLHPVKQDSICTDISLPDTVGYHDSSDSDSDNTDDEDRRLEAKLSHTGSGRVIRAATRNAAESHLDDTEPCPKGEVLDIPPKAPPKKPQPLNPGLVALMETSDIDGDKFQLRFLELCSSNTSPWAQLPAQVARITVKILLNTKNPLIAWRAHRLLSQSVGNDSHRCCFHWAELESTVEQLRLPLGLLHTDSTKILGPALGLQYMVSALEAEVDTSDKHSMRKTKAYEWLSFDRGFSRIHQIIDWTMLAVGYGQYLTATKPQLTKGGRRGTVAPSLRQIPRLLPLFQRLLGVAVSVSRRRDACAARVATEMVRRYVHTPLAAHKQLLMTTVHNPLIKFKLVSEILEDYGSTPDTAPPHGPGITLRDIFTSYGHYEPPLMTLTPPLTPDDAAHDDGRPTAAMAMSPSVGGDEGRYSGESVEELCVLMYHLVHSYLDTTTADVSRDLAIIEQLVSTLESKYRSLTKTLTPKTQLYLSIMVGLRDR